MTKMQNFMVLSFVLGLLLMVVGIIYSAFQQYGSTDTTPETIVIIGTVLIIVSVIYSSLNPIKWRIKQEHQSS